MYPYRTVERALTKMHGNTDAAAARVSARVKHFIRLGFTPESPGKGKRISYAFDDVAKWHYALEILEYGIDPTAMQTIIAQTWDSVCPALCSEDRDQNTLLTIVPRALSFPGIWASFEWTVGEASLYPTNWHQFRRAMTINLSGLAFDLHAALAEVEAEEAGDKVESAFAVPTWATPAFRAATPDEIAGMVDAPGQLPPSIGDQAIFDDAVAGLPLVKAEKATKPSGWKPRLGLREARAKTAADE